MVKLKDHNASVKELRGREPSKNAKTTVCITNHIIEIVAIEKRSQYLNNYQRTYGNMYIDKRTGEVKEYSDSNFINRNRSFTRMRRYINANFTGKENEIFLTLTYANPEFNRSQVSKDIKSFWKKFKYRYKNCEYITVFESHQSGAWHIHMLIKDLQKKYLFIDIKEVRKIWGHGNIFVLKLKDNDNIGAYFSSLCKKEDISDSSKSGRIKYYPRFSKCFTHSANIKKPIYRTMTFENAMKLVESSKEVFSRSIGVFDDNENEVNAIFYKQFNSERKD